jgi:hypothetical protein
MGDDVDISERCIGDVAVDELEMGLIQEVGDVGSAARAEVVDNDDGMTVPEQAAAEVAPDEPGTAGDHEPHRGSPGRDGVMRARSHARIDGTAWSTVTAASPPPTLMQQRPASMPCPGGVGTVACGALRRGCSSRVGSD